jgi:ABC-type Mn2+/Zn2+ transport system ATPase subunit
LENINLTFEKEKVYGIIGENGSGKPHCLDALLD